MTPLLAIAVFSYLVFALVLPTLRTWRRTGVFPVVFHREAETKQRILGLLMSVYLGMLALWSIACAFVPPEQLGIWRLPAVWGAIGWVLYFSGLAITLLAQFHMGVSWRVGIDDRPTELITGGLFALSRNPIFAGMLMTLTGLVLLAPAPASVGGFAFALIVIPLQVRLEERHLMQLHGKPYREYAARVGRFFPLIGRISQQCH